jgi:hypothetical protein
VSHAPALARRSEQKPMKRRTSARLWRIAIACANIRHRPSQQAKKSNRRNIYAVNICRHEKIRRV